MRRLVIQFAACAVLTGWLAANPVAGAEQPDTIRFRGEVTYLSMEGGFWGIIAADGQRYDPGQLPKAFQDNGHKVQVVARPATGRLSFRQWGKAIDIVEIKDDLGH